MKFSFKYCKFRCLQKIEHCLNTALYRTFNQCSPTHRNIIGAFRYKWGSVPMEMNKVTLETQKHWKTQEVASYSPA